MSFAMRGITHCNECGATLGQGEYCICDNCRKEQDKERKKYQKEQETEEIINIIMKRIKAENITYNKSDEDLQEIIEKLTTISTLAKEVIDILNGK